MSHTQEDPSLQTNVVQQCYDSHHSGEHDNNCAFDSAENVCGGTGLEEDRHKLDSVQVTSGSFDTHRRKCTPLQV